MAGGSPQHLADMVTVEDGGVLNYSDKQFSGSLGKNPPANPIVSISGLG